MEKKLVIAIALSAIVLFTFQSISMKKTVMESDVSYGDKFTSKEEVTQQNRFEDIEEKIPMENISSMEFQEMEKEINTDEYRLTFSNIGGSLKRIELNSFTYEGNPEKIIDMSEYPGYNLFSMSSGQIKDLSKRKFTVFEKDSSIEYVFSDSEEIEIKKIYSYFSDQDKIDVEIRVKNLSDKGINFAYKIVGPSAINSDSDKAAGASFIEADAMLDGGVWKVKSIKGVQEKDGIIDWVAMKNRYFTVILKPLSDARSVVMSALEDKKIATAINTSVYDIPPKGEVVNTYVLYVGPMDVKKISSIGYESMKSVVDYGFFGPISKSLLFLLSFFQGVFKNWGVAVILLTCVINLLLFPLTAKSFSSMQKMKDIQPHIQKLRDLHKDNPQRLNKETMELYKKYNVNPLGGCLPMLLQMPIFIALYQGLMRSIELKGAHFLWIKDLSRPDAVPIHFSVPLIGNSINILPLLMVGMMGVQQKISQGKNSVGTMSEQEKQQRIMMLIMPLFFGFLFYGMPSGLVLYWLTNTILMTAEQWYISRNTNK